MTTTGHDTTLVVGQMQAGRFIGLGELVNAIPTQVGSELNGQGAISFDTPVTETLLPTMSALLNRLGGYTFPAPAVPLNTLQYLLPPSVFPAVREVQVWWDGTLIQWGVPISARSDQTRVTVQGSNLLWHFAHRYFGPVINEYLLNPQFENGYTNWTAVNVTNTLDTTIRALGAQAARLAHGVYDDESYISQTFTYTAPMSEGTFFDLAGWFYIDTSSVPFVGGALADRGLYIEGRDHATGIVQNFVYAPVTNSSPTNTWTRCEAPTTNPFIVPAGATWDIEVRCYCGDGQILWDALQLTVQESVGSAVGGSDVANIIANVVAYAQDPNWGKSDLAIGCFTDAIGNLNPIGVVLERHYQFFDNALILDVLNEFPTIGVCDFEIRWSADGRTRWLQIFAPAKGSVKLNQVLELDRTNTTGLTFEVDGSQVASAVRVPGQGSSGSSQEIGYSANAAALGGRQVTDAVTTVNSATMTSATAAFTSADVGQAVYADTLQRGTVIASVTSVTSVQISKPAVSTGSALTLGIGGLIVEEILSPRPNTTIDTLYSQATNERARVAQAQVLPTIKADPAIIIGHLDTGDVTPVLVDYGWAQVLQQLRIVKWTLDAEHNQMELVPNAPTVAP